MPRSYQLHLRSTRRTLGCGFGGVKNAIGIGTTVPWSRINAWNFNPLVAADEQADEQAFL